MKMYTNESQTAKLIEMGFEKPKNIVEGKLYSDTYFAYSIGELLSFLPKSIKVNDLVFKLCIHSNIVSWIVEYADIAFGPQARLYKEELIDALFTEIVVLKEEGVI